MATKFADAMLGLVKALSSSRQEMSKAACEAAEAMAKRREEFEKRQVEIEKDMKRGARLTKHKISL
jgi:hypothetical protein